MATAHAVPGQPLTTANGQAVNVTPILPSVAQLDPTPMLYGQSRYVPITTWKQMAQQSRQSGAAPMDTNIWTLKHNAHIHQVVIDKAPDDASQRWAKFVISTSDVDRERDTIAVTGWDLTDYNDTVLFGHNHNELPIGKARNTGVEDNKLVSTADFPTKGIQGFADTVYDMVKGGFLNRASVGFRPLEWVFNEARGGFDFVKQALLEWSVVPVPALPQATLVEVRSQGIDVQPLLEYYKQQLDIWSGALMTVVPRQVLEDVVRQFSGNPTISIPAGHAGDGPLLEALTQLRNASVQQQATTGPLPVISGVQVASLIFPTAQWPTEEEARAWVDQKGLSTHATKHNAQYWQFSQTPDGVTVPDGSAQVRPIAGLDPNSGERTVLALSIGDEAATPALQQKEPTMTLPGQHVQASATPTYSFDPATGQMLQTTTVPQPVVQNTAAPGVQMVPQMVPQAAPVQDPAVANMQRQIDLLTQLVQQGTQAPPAAVMQNPVRGAEPVQYVPVHQQAAPTQPMQAMPAAPPATGQRMVYMSADQLNALIQDEMQRRFGAGPAPVGPGVSPGVASPALPYGMR